MRRPSTSPTVGGNASRKKKQGDFPYRRLFLMLVIVFVTCCFLAISYTYYRNLLRTSSSSSPTESGTEIPKDSTCRGPLCIFSTKLKAIGSYSMLQEEKGGGKDDGDVRKFRNNEKDLFPLADDDDSLTPATTDRLETEFGSVETDRSTTAEGSENSLEFSTKENYSEKQENLEQANPGNQITGEKEIDGSPGSRDDESKNKPTVSGERKTTSESSGVSVYNSVDSANDVPNLGDNFSLETPPLIPNESFRNLDEVSRRTQPGNASQSTKQANASALRASVAIEQSEVPSEPEKARVTEPGKGTENSIDRNDDVSVNDVSIDQPEEESTSEGESEVSVDHTANANSTDSESDSAEGLAPAEEEERRAEEEDRKIAETLEEPSVGEGVSESEAEESKSLLLSPDDEPGGGISPANFTSLGAILGSGLGLKAGALSDRTDSSGTAVPSLPKALALDNRPGRQAERDLLANFCLQSSNPSSESIFLTNIRTRSSIDLTPGLCLLREVTRLRRQSIRRIAILSLSDENKDWVQAKIKQRMNNPELDFHWLAFRFKARRPWFNLYPNRADGLDGGTDVCPQFTDQTWLRNRDKIRVNALVVFAPCDQNSEWAKDVKRHLFFRSVAQTISMIPLKSVPVVFFSECRPIPNLFSCRHLIQSNSDTWLFYLPPTHMKNMLSLPIGSCKTLLPREYDKDNPFRLKSYRTKREAYVSLMVHDSSYLCGALVLAHSIRRFDKVRDLVLMISHGIPSLYRRALKDAGWKLVYIDGIVSPMADKIPKYKWVYSKLQAAQLLRYNKIVFLDTDEIVLRDLDVLFSMPEFSYRWDEKDRFNSGLFILEPSKCLFDFMLERINTTETYSGGEQGFLNSIFTWWHRLPDAFNFHKEWKTRAEFEAMNKLFSQRPSPVYTIHFYLSKPWSCYRDFDCNWITPRRWRFANNHAHWLWWEAHDLMPAKLQKFCFLRSYQKLTWENSRLAYRDRGFPPEYWDYTIHDQRIDHCFEKEVLKKKKCEWRSKAAAPLDDKLYYEDGKVLALKRGEKLILNLVEPVWGGRNHGLSGDI